MVRRERASTVPGFMDRNVSLITLRSMFRGSSRIMRYASVEIPMLSPILAVIRAEIILDSVSLTLLPKQQLMMARRSPISMVTVSSVGTVYFSVCSSR